MLAGLCTLLLFELVGIGLTQLVALPFPGTLIGLILLLAVLVWRGGPSKGLEQCSAALLGCLALFYVPAAAGLVSGLDLLASDWWRIGLAILISTSLGLSTTALVMRRLSPKDAP